MDDRLTISFGAGDPRRPPISPETATVARVPDDATERGTAAVQRVESTTGFGEGRRYRLLRELGHGGMGTVYEGWDALLQRSVAIKIMDAAQGRHPDGLSRFFREARIAGRLAHPAIITIHEFDVTADGQAFIVMQLLAGRTLKEILADVDDREAALPGLLAIFLEVCQAVASAHDAGVIHRDLKPSNIMACSFGVVSVMDWGVAKVLADDWDGDGPVAASGVGFHPVERHDLDGDDNGRTMTGTIFGTPAYLAPEQARGEIDRVDRRADVFGLGGILCELLTGHAPFEAADADARCRLAAAGAITAAVARLERCGGPLPLIALAKRCLATEADDRPADAGQVVASLTAFLESGQRRAEQELVRFFDLSLDLFCIAGLDGRFHRLNDTFARRLGYSVAELQRRPFLDFVHPDDRERTRGEMARLAAGQPTLQFLNRYRRADGHYLWLEWSAHTAVEENAVYAVARDVSRRMEEAALRERLEQERTTLAGFAAAAGLFLTAPGPLAERLRHVAEEGVSLLGIAGMEIWRLDAGAAPRPLAAAGMESVVPTPRPAAVVRLVAEIAHDRHPQHITADSAAWRAFADTRFASGGSGSFIGYPLLVGERIVGVMAVYAVQAVSDVLVTAMSSTVASLALAIVAADETHGGAN